MAESRTSSGSNSRGRGTGTTIQERPFKNKTLPSALRERLAAGHPAQFTGKGKEFPVHHQGRPQPRNQNSAFAD